MPILEEEQQRARPGCGRFALLPVAAPVAAVVFSLFQPTHWSGGRHYFTAGLHRDWREDSLSSPYHTPAQGLVLRVSPARVVGGLGHFSIRRGYRSYEVTWR